MGARRSVSPRLDLLSGRCEDLGLDLVIARAMPGDDTSIAVRRRPLDGLPDIASDCGWEDKIHAVLRELRARPGTCHPIGASALDEHPACGGFFYDPARSREGTTAPMWAEMAKQHGDRLRRRLKLDHPAWTAEHFVGRTIGAPGPERARPSASVVSSCPADVAPPTVWPGRRARCGRGQRSRCRGPPVLGRRDRSDRRRSTAFTEKRRSRDKRSPRDGTPS